ncbi:MAG: FHA domain-containing protein [Planctomycetaceae bacterium]
MSADVPNGNDDDLWDSFQAAFGDALPDPVKPPPDTHASLPGHSGVNANRSEPPADISAANLSAADISTLMSQLQQLAPRSPSADLSPPITSRHDTLPPPGASAGLSGFPLPAAQSLPSAPVFAVPDMRAVSATGRAGTVRLEQRGGTSLKVNHKAVVALRLMTMSRAVKYRLSLQSDLLEESMIFCGSCPDPGVYNVGSLRFVPVVAGAEEIRVQLVILNDNDIPIDCLTGSFVVQVESDQSHSIHAGGDVIVMGGRPGGLLPNIGSVPTDVWNDVELVADASWGARTARLKPQPPEDQPTELRIAADFRAATGAMYVGRADGSFRCYAVSAGLRASIGRGGADDVCWWIRPVPDRDGRFSRISRRHVSIELRDQYAWLTDHSANGTLLNGVKLATDEATVLADGDTVDVADAIRFSLHLFTGSSGVSAVELVRNDSLSDQLRLLLVKPGCPHRISWGNESFWVAWSKNECLQLNRGGDAWDNLKTGDEQQVNDSATLSWHQVMAAIDQDQLF